MKRIFLILAVTLLVLLSGCEELDNLRTSILKQIDTTTESVSKKAVEVRDQIKQTKDAVEQKISDIENAAKEVQEAVDAVKKVTGETPEESAQASSPDAEADDAVPPGANDATGTNTAPK